MLMSAAACNSLPELLRHQPSPVLGQGVTNEPTCYFASLDEGVPLEFTLV